MGNLGAYQLVTTISKKVGGPFPLLGIVAVGGYVVFRGIEAGGKRIYKLIKKKADNFTEKLVNPVKYMVNAEGTSNEGIHFNIGDEFFILEEDGEAVLIDKIGDPDSPCFIAKDFLEQLSAEVIEKAK